MAAPIGPAQKDNGQRWVDVSPRSIGFPWTCVDRKYCACASSEFENPEPPVSRISSPRQDFVADGRRLQSSNMGRRAQEFEENAKRKAVSVPATKRRKREDASDEGSDDEEAMVPEALTRKIISQARQQQEEMESEEAPKQPRRGVSFAPVLAAAAGDEDDDGEDGGEDDPEDEVTAEYSNPNP